MKKTIWKWCLLVVAFVVPATAYAINSNNSNNAQANVDEPSELEKMYVQDQKDRMEVGPNPKPEQWVSVRANDEAHHARVLELLQQDKVKAADDFYYAAMIMQHGDTPKDYMLAHILAMAAAQKGNKQAVWLSAASFDRLMMSAKQPQIFGTQYFANKGEPLAVNEPFDAALITDSMRKVFDVPTLKENEERIKMLNSKKSY